MVTPPKPPGTNDADRRHAERIPINGEFRRLDDAAATWVSDLSATGVFIHTPDLLAVGTAIELRFTILLDDPIVIEATGSVARHSQEPLGMGVAFAGMGGEMRARIDEALARQAPRDPGRPIAKPIETRGLTARPVEPGKAPTFRPPPAPPRRPGR